MSFSLSFPARRSLAEQEKLHADSVAEHKKVEKRLQAATEKLQRLESRVQDESRESSELEMLNQQLATELEDEKTQHQKDLEDSDFASDQTRKKYQGLFLYTSFDVVLMIILSHQLNWPS